MGSSKYFFKSLKLFHCVNFWQNMFVYRKPFPYLFSTDSWVLTPRTVPWYIQDRCAQVMSLGLKFVQE